MTQGLNGLLDGWIQRNSKYPDHAAKISYDETMVTSKRQLEAKLGLGFEKVSAKLNVDFDAIHKRERQVAIASFKQIYYTASVDTPTSPHSVFGPNVTAQDLKDRGVNNKNPLGYISSVSYGRQILSSWKRPRLPMMYKRLLAACSKLSSAIFPQSSRLSMPIS